MYSKDRGITRREKSSPMDDRYPSYRQSRPERVQVPPNYSGHAIVDGEERPLGSMIPPEMTAPPASELPIAPQPTPRFDGLPRVSELGDSHRHQPRTLPASFAVAEEAQPSREAEGPHETSTQDGPPADTVKPSPRESASRSTGTPALGHSLFASARSFLGNGLGLEELLLLGLILFLLREGEGEDRGDLDETVILLGLLLLLG